MGKNSLVFEEVVRIVQTDTEDLVVSKVKDKDTGALKFYFINYHIKALKDGDWKGPLKGTKVFEGEVVEFLKAFDKELLQEALNE
jgi:hypothetical protein